MSIVLSELLSPQNKGELDTLVLLQQQDHDKKRYVRVHTHICIQIYVYKYMYEYFCMNTEGVPATL